MNQNLLSVPKSAALSILKTGGVLTCELLSSDRFLKFCQDRGFSIKQDRLLQFEGLGIFRPVFRVKATEEVSSLLKIPLKEDDQWFDNGWAWDTTGLKTDYEIPEKNNREHEAYYSEFQIYDLEVALSAMTLNVQLDSYLTPFGKVVDWNKNGENWLKYANSALDNLKSSDYRLAVALLCQFISDRYYPETQGDQRSIRISAGNYSDRWIRIFDLDWDWYDYSKNWKPEKVEKLFELTPEKLEQVYTGLACSQSHSDPIEKWYQLTQFISIGERLKLKGKALYAETLRSAAHMIRMLYKDLYKDELDHPNEVASTVITHVPELEVREDVRRYLEFVVNRYNLNPQPILTLFVEGESEEAAISMIFNKYVGSHIGIYGIEIINLHGVDTATGNKKEDRFRAILRLIDYLHHHQTLTFLILDNENYANRLKKEAKKAKSMQHGKRYITRPEYIKIWQDCFEFDNFSCSEISEALNVLAKGQVKFSRSEVILCKKSDNSGAALSTLYKQKTGFGLKKVELNTNLTLAMLAEKKGKKLTNRPIIQTLERVAKLAIRNPFPIMREDWENNQSSKYLGKKR